MKMLLRSVTLGLWSLSITRRNRRNPIFLEFFLARVSRVSSDASFSEDGNSPLFCDQSRRSPKRDCSRYCSAALSVFYDKRQ